MSVQDKMSISKGSNLRSERSDVLEVPEHIDRLDARDSDIHSKIVSGSHDKSDQTIERSHDPSMSILSSQDQISLTNSSSQKTDNSYIKEVAQPKDKLDKTISVMQEKLSEKTVTNDSCLENDGIQSVSELEVSKHSSIQPTIIITDFSKRTVTDSNNLDD